MYCAYVTRIHNLRKHTNADRLLCGECFGNTVIVDLGTDPDQLGVYFPTDGKLGLEFAQKNDLLRRKDENGAPAGGYLDPEKRNIKALKLRGEKSDGLFLPLSCLASFTDIKKLQEGDTISVLNGITICEKYVPAVKRASGSGGGGNHVRKRSDPISPLFQEHADTEQLAYNLSAFHAGDLVEVTLKMHGTSQRTGYLPVLQGYKYRNRRLIIPPCKVGDTVWVITGTTIKLCTVDRIHILGNGQMQIRAKYFVTDNIYLYPDMFGKTVFLTCAEAEAAIEARKGDKE